jgi:hypothetical protein
LALPARAHVSEQGIVLLLPTGFYTVGGVLAVALTVLALFAVPGAVVRRSFAWRALPERSFETGRMVTSLCSLVILGFMIWLGLTGSRDPLSNLMPLMFWTVGWVALVSLSGVFGNLWLWLNPWTGLYRLIGSPAPLGRLPNFGLWPALVLLLGFWAFVLADIAPDDPTRLARFVAMYWAVTFAGLVVFGPRWLQSCELGHAIFAAYGALAPWHWGKGVGGPGWQIVTRHWPTGAGVFAIAMLGAGSFDGINETFWWLGQIGVNPLEFPGRSAVVVPTLLGLLGMVAALIVVFALTVQMGIAIAGSDVAFGRAFGVLALSLLPIALVYHAAHYLTSFLVSIQYTVAAVSDPFARGDDWLGIEPFRVTTGFFNTVATVQLIWFSQAGLVVLGHVWSVLLAHRLALDLFGAERRAALATLPLSVFMIGYTWLGLWLLAAPRGA